MKLLSYLLTLGILAAGVILTPQRSTANPDYTKRTGKRCVVCHVGDWSSGKYTEAGQYYKDHRTFKGYAPKR